MTDGIPTLAALEPGWVWLAGAGPGDPGLLTLICFQAIRQADVIVHDALVDERILDLARPGTRLQHAGKRGGKPSPAQRDITLSLIEHARAGHRVLRLKGGDPLVFGRGGEEALGLVAAGIPFRIIPGITAGIGGLAHAGIPLTHRDVNHTVTFVTGHDASGAAPGGIDWAAVAKGSQVLVFYMAIKHWPHIRQSLLDSGRSAGEPVAFVCNAATERQTVIETTLDRSAEDLACSKIVPPAVVVVGEVVRLRAGMDWLGALAGRKLEPDPLGIADLRKAE